MFTMKTDNDFNEINLDGTIYRPRDGIVEVHVKSHAEILSRPAFGFRIIASQASEAVDDSPAVAPALAAQFPLNENHGNIWALFERAGVAFGDTATIDTILLAINEALGAETASAAATDKPMTATEQARAELDELGVTYASGASLKVLQALIEQHKPKE